MSLSIHDLRRYAAKCVIAGLVGCALFGFGHSDQLFRSYLTAYLVFLGIGLGCLGLLLLHSLVGGAWGQASRGVLQAGAETMPWLTLLFLPIVIGLRHIYPWANGTAYLVGAANPAHKVLYFNHWFFVVRSMLYFGLWSWMSKRQRQTMAGSGACLALYVLTVSFASFDWVMSLEPHWSSSIYGAMLMVGDVLGALAFALVILAWQSRLSKPSLVDEDTAHDLGNLLLAFTMLWIYMALSQYMIIWSANLPDEIGWYLARQRGGWQCVAIFLVLCQFFLPFALLLARERKRKLERLALVAAWILAMRVVDVFWLTAPDFSPGRFSIHWLDLFTLITVGGVWMYFYAGFLLTEEDA